MGRGMILLSPEKIKIFSWNLERSPEGYMDNAQRIALVQLKEVVKWGDELCYDHNGAQRKEQGWYVKRCECPPCWQVLLKEAE